MPKTRCDDLRTLQGSTLVLGISTPEAHNRRARPRSLKVEASRLAKQSHIARAIRELRKQRPPEELVVAALDDDWVVEGLQALAVRDYSNSRTKLGALEMLCRIQQMVK